MIKNETNDIHCPECGEELIVSVNKIVEQKLYCDNQFCQNFVVEFWSQKIPKTKEDKMPEKKRQVGTARLLIDSESEVVVDLPLTRGYADYTTLDDRLILKMNPGVAADLMHLLEEWKDER